MAESTDGVLDGAFPIEPSGLTDGVAVQDTMIVRTGTSNARRSPPNPLRERMDRSWRTVTPSGRIEVPHGLQGGDQRRSSGAASNGASTVPASQSSSAALSLPSPRAASRRVCSPELVADRRTMPADQAGEMGQQRASSVIDGSSLPAGIAAADPRAGLHDHRSCSVGCLACSQRRADERNDVLRRIALANGSPIQHDRTLVGEQHVVQVQVAMDQRSTTGSPAGLVPANQQRGAGAASLAARSE